MDVYTKAELIGFQDMDKFVCYAEAESLRAQLAELKGGLAYRNSLVCRLETERDELNAEIERLKAEPTTQNEEYKTWWELALHVGAWKDHELDYVHFGSEMAVRAYAILLLRQRDKYEDELKRQNAGLSVNAERYLWIRDAANGEPYASEFHPCIKLSLDTKTDNDFCAEYSLDKAIDAAKGASNGNAEV